MLKMFFVLLFLINILITNESGIGVHLEVCERAKDYLDLKYQNLINSHQNYFQLGIIFPDWGYILGYGPEAELAHSELIIKKLLYITNELSDSIEKYQLIVFILGMACHTITDNLFHGNNNDLLSFISVQALIDYDINCQKNLSCYTKSHDYADNGADVILYRLLNINYLNFDWIFPKKILNIIYNSTIDDFTIKWRLFIYQLQLKSMQYGFANLAYYKFDNLFMTLYLNDWIKGGIDHMASTTLQYWNVMFNLTLSKKVQNFDNCCLNFDNIIVIDINSDGLNDLIISNPTYGLLTGCVCIKFNSTNIINSIKFNDFDIIIEGYDQSRFGHSIIALDINLDNITELIVSAPLFGDYNITKLSFNYDEFKGDNKGALFIYQIINNNYKLINVIQPSKNDTYFGWTLEKSDTNNDFLDDLIVGSPFSNENNEVLTGRVSIIHATNHNLSINHELIGENKLSWFGFKIKATANLLIISALLMNSGMIYGYRLSDLKLQFIIQGHEIRSMFGYELIVANEYLIISSINLNLINFIKFNNLSGEYLVNKISEKTIHHNTKSLFGLKIIINSDLLFISEPFRSNCIMCINNGAVHIYNLTNFDYVRSIKGYYDKQQFGINIHLINNQLLIVDKDLLNQFKLKIYHINNSK
jgi:hypothetical protein